MKCKYRELNNNNNKTVFFIYLLYTDKTSNEICIDYLFTTICHIFIRCLTLMINITCIISEKLHYQLIYLMLSYLFFIVSIFNVSGMMIIDVYSKDFNVDKQ